MLSLHQIQKNYSTEAILRNITFSINERDRVGLIGPNGCGKTTLLRIITGEETPDAGSVRKPGALRVGYLPQGILSSPGESIHAYLRRFHPDEDEEGAELESVAEALVLQPDDPSLQERYNAAVQRMEQASQEDASANTLSILGALGLASIPGSTELSHLSGGQKTRLALAAILLSKPQLLLLDEPTNHLDIGMLEWLEEWLASFRGAALIVSHDRVFLDRTVKRILELDPASHEIREFEGAYSSYADAKAAELERQRMAHDDWRQKVVALRDTAMHLRGLARFRKGGKADSGDKFAKAFFANRSLGTMRRAKQIESRVEKLLTTDRVEKPRQSRQIRPEFEPAETTGNDVLVLENLAAGYEGVPLLSGINLHLRRGMRAAIIGENGKGKTTLLRTIAGKIPPLNGRVRLGTNVRLGFMTQEQETLDPKRNALETVLNVLSSDETEVRRFLHKYLFSGDDVFVPVGRLSYGERARLMLALLAAEGCNFLLLDEPINHLDIPSRERFEQALATFEGTILAVVHDRYFLTRFAEEIWSVDSGSLTRYYADDLEVSTPDPEEFFRDA